MKNNNRQAQKSCSLLSLYKKAMLSAAFFLLWRSGGGVGAEGNTGKVQFRSRNHYKDDIAFFQN